MVRSGLDTWRLVLWGGSIPPAMFGPFGALWLGPVMCGLVGRGKARSGSIWIGMVRFGLLLAVQVA